MGLWQDLHLFARSYVGKDVNAFDFHGLCVQKIEEILAQLPPGCECIQDSRDYMTTINPINAESGYHFFWWTFDFHNYVNQKIGKPLFKTTEIEALYGIKIGGIESPIPHRATKETPDMSAEEDDIYVVQEWLAHWFLVMWYLYFIAICLHLLSVLFGNMYMSNLFINIAEVYGFVSMFLLSMYLITAYVGLVDEIDTLKNKT
jgi:hypothetical protein